MLRQVHLYIFDHYSSSDNIGRRREGRGNQKIRRRVFYIGAISIEMGLGTTKIYKNCRDSSTMRGGEVKRTEYTIETPREIAGRNSGIMRAWQKFRVGGRIILSILYSALQPPRTHIYIYGVYCALTCAPLKICGEYQKLLLYVNFERGKKDFSQGI